MAHNAIIALNNGLLVRQRPSVRKQQLKCFSFLRKNVHTFSRDLNVAVQMWNSIPEDVRNRPETLVVAVRASSAWHEGGKCGIDVNAAVARATLLNEAGNLRIAGDASPSLLSWLSHHANHVYHENRYSPAQVIFDMQTIDPEIACVKVKQPWGIAQYSERSSGAVQSQMLGTPVAQFCSKRWNDVLNICLWIIRRKEQRMRLKRDRDEVLLQTDYGLTLKERMERAQDRITQVRPLHWATHLSNFQKVVASKLRPDGRCFGIELEFLASKGSRLAVWDEDEYPEYKFHFFHTDGSISSNNSGECLPRFQEYSCFINGDNPQDWSNVKSVLSEMVSNGAVINGSCGNHVHLDMRHKSQASYYRTAGRVRSAVESWVHRMVSCTRAYNHYCHIHGSHHSNRYTAVNTQSWPEHRTLEIRLGMPTLNYTKLQHWTQFLQYISSDRADMDTLDEFLEGNAPMHLKCYALRRIKKFRETYVRNSHADLPNYDKYMQVLNAIEGYNTSDTDNQ